MTSHEVFATRAEWQKQLSAMPVGNKLPTLFLAHGQPMLIARPEVAAARFGKAMGPEGPLANFLRDLGPALLKTYNPKAIVVFSAHWETSEETRVTDYGSDQPLLYDYYGFSPDLYNVPFHSSGDSALSARVVQLLKQAGLPARTTKTTEARGQDGRGFEGTGLDHGVFVPFSVMFGSNPSIPIVQVSINSSLNPDDEWALGRALEPLRSEGVLIIAGGLTIHTFRDHSAWSADTAADVYKTFERAIVDAVGLRDSKAWKEALVRLTKHDGFRASHPREEHFVPLYVAAGAADDGREQGQGLILMGGHGCKTVLFM